MKEVLKKRVIPVFIFAFVLLSCVIQTKIRDKSSKAKGYDFLPANKPDKIGSIFENDSGSSNDTTFSYDENSYDEESQDNPDVVIRVSEGEKKNLWVMDSTGEEVGILVMSQLFTSTGCNISDVVTVYNPECKLFFSIRMTDAEVMLPQKVFFSDSGCDGEIYVSALSCEDCYSGYNIGFKIGNNWYKIKGGKKRVTKSVLSAMQKGFSKKCSYHHGNTYVFPVVKVESCTKSFKPPLFYSWR